MRARICVDLYVCVQNTKLQKIIFRKSLIKHCVFTCAHTHIQKCIRIFNILLVFHHINKFGQNLGTFPPFCTFPVPKYFIQVV